MVPVKITRTNQNRRNTKMSIIEEPSHGIIFDRFRNQPGMNILWIKENVYGTPCLPECCPVTRDIDEVLNSLGGGLEDGEILNNKRRCD